MNLRGFVDILTNLIIVNCLLLDLTTLITHILEVRGTLVRRSPWGGEDFL